MTECDLIWRGHFLWKHDLLTWRIDGYNLRWRGENCGWMNVHPLSDGQPLGGKLWRTREEADTYSRLDRIACIYVDVRNADSNLCVPDAREN